MTSRFRVAIAGASGRMGRMLIEQVLASADLKLTVALDQPGSAALGQDAGAFLGQATGVAITSDLAALADADGLIDFTRPDGTLAHLDVCTQYGVCVVIGTTGFDATQKAKIGAAAQTLPIVLAPNMSVGVNVTYKLLEKAALLLQQDYDVEIFEAHHNRKVDAPSGTALGMGEAVARAWGVELSEVADWARHGHTGARQQGRIGFSVLRGGDIVGDHTVYFCGTGERIEITHRSSSRATYAQGSLRALRFLRDRAAGLYDMQDVLGLR